MRLLRRLSRSPQNLYQFLRDMLLSGDALTLVIAFILLLMPALSLSDGNWPLRLRVIVPVIGFSLLFGYVLARSRYDELLALLVSAAYGGATVLLVGGLSESLNPLAGIEAVLIRSIQWLVDIFTGGINQDDLVFSMLVASLFWYLGYNTVWHLFRIDRVGRLLLPPALILLMNMVIYTGDNNLDIYLVIFMFMALLLVVRSSLGSREWEWYHNDVRVPRKLRGQFLRTGATMSLLAVLIAFLIPTGNLQERVENFREFISSDPVQQLTEFWSRLISPLDSDGPASSDYYGGDNLDLGGAIRLGDDIILYASAPNDRRYYWRSRIFESYNNGNWSSTATLRVTDTTSPIDPNFPPDMTGNARVPVEQRFTIGTGGTRLFYTAPQPLRVEGVGRIDVLRLQPELEGDSLVNLSVIRPAKVIERGESYGATSLMSVATANQLRAAGTDYPDWVQGSAQPAFGVTPLIAETAAQIITAAGATNNYDRAKAIETWLRQNITYNERIAAPPPGMDTMEWFLTEREGYCTYYATAMILMLRSQGIPARMAAGFAQGTFDAALNQFVVRERDAHTWVEVYFPGYGWVEFEPTSAEQPLNRDGDEAFNQETPQNAQLPPTPIPTSTPTIAPSPTAIPTSTPDGAGNPEDDNQQQPPPLPTLTATATATVTPVIVPTVQPPTSQPPPPPPDDSFLNFLLGALGQAVLVALFILVLVLIGVFIYWWWEWRGMGGLSPIARAFARLERYMALIGITPREQDTTEEKRRTMVRKLPGIERPITAITRTYTRERYSPYQPGTPEAAQHEQIAEEFWKPARHGIVQRWLRKFMFWRRDR